MAIDHYPTKSKDWCVAKIDALSEQEASGKISTSAGAGDVTGSFLVEAGTATLKRKLYESLMVKDPDGSWHEYMAPTTVRAVFAQP